ncbi:hypothetical protein B0H13DRAFT_1604008, partial [Mycena leptocephala]
VGMPVMIKTNEATELCITKGQEAIVVGWDSSVGPSGQKILDTLFVKLTNSPRDTQIPDFLNVVSLGRTSNHVTCLLRDDSLLSLNREQVMVLPNFSMTDYASQGKGRDINVVHLNNCKNHHNYYVALSRGYEADGTRIIQGFDPKKITSGIPGYLRQEFRELELLDELTKLRHDGCLPRQVTGIYWGKLIASYRTWKGHSTDPLHFHPAIRSKPDDKEPQTDYGVWKPTVAKSPAKKPRQNKRKPEEQEDQPPAKKTTINHSATSTFAIPGQSISVAEPSTRSVSPLGLVWDSTDNSCAYDAFFTPLASVWAHEPELWTQRPRICSPVLGMWATVLAQGPLMPERARDAVRTNLRSQNAADFPLGPRGIALDTLFMGLADRRSYGSAVTYCEECMYTSPGVIHTFGQYQDIFHSNTLRRSYPNGPTVSQWLLKMRRLTTIHDIPSLIILAINVNDLILEQELVFDNGSILRLRGLIYHLQPVSQHSNIGHFTGVVVGLEGEMWYHDGITTRRNCVRSGRFPNSTGDRLTLHRRHDQRLCAAIYAL